MKTLNEFRNIKDTMCWKEAALTQLKGFEDLAERLGIALHIVGSHVSKSIRLPVVELQINNDIFFLRDNFGDVNLCVRAENPIDLPLADLLQEACQECDWNWYLSQIAKCRGYTWEYFTDEEMDDPVILHVYKKHKMEPTGKKMDWSVLRDEKDRWLKRMTDPSWFCHNWSSGTICWEGEFGPEAKLFVQYHPYAEGIRYLVPACALKPYVRGTRDFALALDSLESAELIIRRVSRLKCDTSK